MGAVSTASYAAHTKARAGQLGWGLNARTVLRVRATPGAGTYPAPALGAHLSIRAAETLIPITGLPHARQ
jgi:hypothetical protein